MIMFKFKKAISICVILTIFMGILGTTALAANPTADETVPQIKPEMTMLDIERIRNIPFFVAEVEISDEAAWEAVDDLLTEVFATQITSRETKQKLEQAGIRQLDYAEILDVINHPIYAHAIARLQELLADDSLTINFVTFFAPVNISDSDSSSLNSNRYGQFLALHGGFEFRFHDVAFNFETNWFTHTNTTMNWSQLATATGRLAVNVIGGPVSSIVTVLGHMSNFGSAVNVPFNVRITTTGTHSTGIRHRVTGNLVDRLILIQDRLNRDPVNSFVGIAHLDMFHGRPHLRLTRPIQVSGTTVTLTDVVYTSGAQTQIRTHGWFAPSSLLDTLVNRYNSAQWWQPYTERLNLNSLVLTLTQ